MEIGLYDHRLEFDISQNIRSWRLARILVTNHSVRNHWVGWNIVYLHYFRAGLGKYKPWPNSSDSSIDGLLRGVSRYFSCNRLIFSPMNIADERDESGNFKAESTPIAPRIVIASGVLLIALGWLLIKKGRGPWCALGTAFLIVGVLVLDHGLTMQDAIRRRSECTSFPEVSFERKPSSSAYAA